MTEPLDLQFEPELALPIADGAVYPMISAEDYRNHHSYDILDHYNICHEMHIVLSGSCQFNLNDQTVTLHAGEGVYIAPGCVHYPHDWSEDFDRITFRFTTSSQSLEKHYLGPIRDFRVCSLSPEMVALCHSIYGELDMGNDLGHEMLTALFTQLMVGLLRALADPATTKRTPPKVALPSRISLIDGFFFNFPFRFGTEQELADLLGLSSRQLHRVLLDYYGMGFQQKLLHSRMMYAACLLRTTEKKAGEIGAMLGYSDDASFHKAFKAYYKMTPMAFRKASRTDSGSKP